ncbi:MAG: hypothetical protein ACTTK2_01580 [Hoylesella marshii]|uniref:hypothetical protein n=1 Tax=Hoylesella marshii TaxID=189722 RepID=UPI003FA1431C
MREVADLSLYKRHLCHVQIPTYQSSFLLGYDVIFIRTSATMCAKTVFSDYFSDTFSGSLMLACAENAIFVMGNRRVGTHDQGTLFHHDKTVGGMVKQTGNHW